jgi:hypothetical protein
MGRNRGRALARGFFALSRIGTNGERVAPCRLTSHA